MGILGVIFILIRLHEQSQIQPKSNSRQRLAPSSDTLEFSCPYCKNPFTFSVKKEQSRIVNNVYVNNVFTEKAIEITCNKCQSKSYLNINYHQ